MSGKGKPSKPVDVERWKVPPEEREKVIRQFSFDVDSLHHRISAGDNWSRVLGAHLYFDHVITKMLEEELSRPEKIDLDRISFSAKLDLCAAMGLLDGQATGVLRAINKIRNSLAHDLNYQITDADIERLYALASKAEQELIDEQRVVYPEDAPLFRILATALVLLDIRRQWLRDSRSKRAEAFKNARALLERMRDGSPNDDGQLS